ncbi:D-arabinono-1,4-lactone oxidase [Tomitella cavernea]|nr:D-arabinono-1,4-lactone oxidase [Tomitella cavernea]
MTGTTWRNWADCAHAEPQAVAHPADAEEVAGLIQQAAATGLPVKAVGAGHSFTPVAVTTGMQIHLDRLTGIAAVVPTSEGAHVTVYAGTRLERLNELLWSLGLSMINLGDIDMQTLAGAIATGTHGTGAAFGGLATQVVGLEIVTATGEVVTCSAERNPTLFEAARLGLGALGVITTMTIACRNAYVMHAEERPEPLDAVLSDLERIRTSVDHFEFYWWPHTHRVLTKRNTRLPGATPLRPVGRIRGYIDDELLSNTVFGGINAVSTRVPAIIPRANALAARLLSAREFTDAAHRVFASSRRVRFREMEYAVPVAELPGVLERIDRLLTDGGHRIGFPIEVRFAAADDVWLSTAHGRDTAYVAVHMYWKQDQRRYFRAVEDIARSVDGRPHWGKLHRRAAADLRPAYPRFDDFVAVRDEVDPDRVFGNDYLARVLG